MITRLLLIILVVCLPSVARGQTGIDYAYWFDNDRSTLHSGHSSTGNIGFDADVSALTFGLHAIHIVCTDQKGDQSVPHTRYFVKAFNSQGGHGSYWFDDDNTHVFNTATMGGAFEIDVSHLTDGFHSIYYEAMGADGTLTNTVRRTFCKVNIPTSNGYRCWVDEDYSTVSTGESIDGTAIIDVSDIADGYHVLHTQVFGGGTMSVPITRPFIKAPKVHQAEYLTCVVTIDDKLYSQQNVQSPDGIIDLSLQVEGLSQGLHRLMVQVLTPSGAATNTYNAFFLRSATTAEYGQMKCVYCVDGSEFYTATGSADGLNFHFNLDVASLSDGLHRLSYMLSNGKGVSTKTQTQFFIKTPLGGNGITEYWYWLNDRDSIPHKVTLPKPQDPFSLISLLPVEKVPVRSSQFEFRVEQEQPKIYAKNDIHLRFYDVTGRFVDATHEYVDEQVSDAVTDLTLLTPGVRATTSRPEDNIIKWYMLTAERGDTVAFKSSQACSLQLFSPSGKEVYSASGNTSVAFGGCHTWEDGTYYLAVHDVTGSQSQLSLDYMHMAKYDVVRQDVKVVGNGGCSTITFDGNGFYSLYAVDLFNEQGDTIHHADIGYESDASTSIAFDFIDASLGQYHALFHFADEDKVFNNLVTVEEARDITLSITSKHADRYLRGRTTTYTYNITNNGNMTAYSVPIYAYISSKTLNGISNISIKGLELESLYDYIQDKDSIDAQDLSELKELLDGMGDDHYFFKIPTVDEESGDSVVVRSGLFAIQLPPNTTKTITIELQSTEKVEAWLTIPSEWHPIITEEQEIAGSRPAKIPEWLCCYHDRLECIGTIIVDIADLVGLLPIPAGEVASAVSCITGVINQAIKSTAEVFCDKNSNKSFWKKVRSSIKGVSLTGTILTCVGKALRDTPFTVLVDIKKAISAFTFGLDVGSSFYDYSDCKKAWTQKKPGCPPGDPEGGESNPVNSLDPNDIFGYTASSGSHAVKDGLTDVYYRVEFENDTTFATSCAHDVWVTDTLDATKLDLSTYAPTQIRIGEHVEQLDGTPNFVKTIDLRPDIYAVAQIEGTFDKNKGIAKWHFSSLDPMTMEPTNDPKEGFLPINFDGRGIGEVSYDISLKPGLAHGTEIKNRAGIVFDNNDVIMTPTWTNTIDRVKPVSRIADVNLASDTTAVVSIKASDDGSGPWRYNVYVQYGSGAWFLAAENVPSDTTATVKIYDGIVHHFYCVATDMAGNVEEKDASSEFTFTVSEHLHGDANSDGTVDVADIAEVIDVMAKGEYRLHDDTNNDGVVDVADIAEIIDIMAAMARAAAAALE